MLKTQKHLQKKESSQNLKKENKTIMNNDLRDIIL